jgi:hypothetical protein
MTKKLDPIALLVATSVSLAAAIAAAWVYNLGWNEIATASFFGTPLYLYIFFMPIGFPIYFWVSYLRTKKSIKK